MFALFLCGEFFLHVLCCFLFVCLFFNLGSFSFSSYAGFIFMWGVFLTHPVLASFLSGEFLLYIPYWLHFYLARCSYISRAGFVIIWGASPKHAVSLPHLMLASFFDFLMWGVSYTSHAGFFFSSGEFLLNIPCWVHFDVGSFSYTSHVCFISLWEVLLHVPCWLHFYLASFSYTSRAGFIIIWLDYYPKHPMLASFSGREFLLHIPCWLLKTNLVGFSYTSHTVLFIYIYIFLNIYIFLIWGVSLTHPMFALFLCGDFFLHVPCWLHFYLGSFSYTSHAGYIFI